MILSLFRSGMDTASIATAIEIPERDVSRAILSEREKRLNRWCLTERPAPKAWSTHESRRRDQEAWETGIFYPPFRQTQRSTT